MDETLPASSIVVTMAAVETYAKARHMQTEEARRELTRALWRSWCDCAHLSG
jgi:hypothetical protein